MLLHLSNMELQGQFPQSLELWTSWTGLNLLGNILSGPFPANISHQLPSKTSLNLSSSSFCGEIPGNIANMKFLNTLNQFGGQIPEQIGDLTRTASMNLTDSF